jgi:hypothetical protein
MVLYFSSELTKNSRAQKRIDEAINKYNFDVNTSETVLDFNSEFSESLEILFTEGKSNPKEIKTMK